ncbi:MAG: DUF378 domain-containing protein [Armatimonadota bacterium]|nr:DUF378 domain-containing protein [Armatimonadota bacterium]
MRALTIMSLILIVIGALNWGLVGLFGYNLIGAIFGLNTVVSRVILTFVGLAGLFGIFVLGKLIESRDDVCVPGHITSVVGQTR